MRSFLNLKLLHYRFTGAATGYLKSFYEQGYGAYRMGYHPLYIIARGFRHMIDKPYVMGGLALIWAYIRAWLNKEEMLADPSVVSYIHRTQLRQLAGLFVGRTIHQ